MIGVYTIINLINNKIYVGSSHNSIEKRLLEHLFYLKNNKHQNIYLQRAFNKYGENSFIFEILEEHDPEFCLTMEKYWITLLNTKNYKFGYNINDPVLGRRGIKHTQESILKMKENRKGLTAGNKNAMYGTTWSEERRKNILKGYEGTTLKPVLQFDLNGDFIKEFKSIREAEKSLNIKSSCIGKVCKGRYTKAYNYKWKFKN